MLFARDGKFTVRGWMVKFILRTHHGVFRRYSLDAFGVPLGLRESVVLLGTVFMGDDIPWASVSTVIREVRLL